MRTVFTNPLNPWDAPELTATPVEVLEWQSNQITEAIKGWGDNEKQCQAQIEKYKDKLAICGQRKEELLKAQGIVTGTIEYLTRRVL